jgi:hypothetical protein
MAKTMCSEQDYKTRKDVAKSYPDAAKIVKVCGGWMVFEYITDYEVWRKQK